MRSFDPIIILALAMLFFANARRSGARALQELSGKFQGWHTRESLGAYAAHSVQCSNFIAAHPEIRRILNHGTPLQSEMWHPIARPHYRLPAELPPLVTTLKGIEDSVEVAHDAWTLGEVRKLREGCEWAIRHGLALVVFFGNTLSGSTLPGKGFAR